MSRPAHWPPPNTVNPETKAPMIIGVFIGFTVLAVMVVGLRFWTRLYIIRNIGMDDWFILAATINLLASTVTNCLVVKYYSFGMHVWDIVADYGTLALKMDFANQLVYHPILALTKISILVFYYRLSVSGAFRQTVMALIIINVALTVSIFFADFFQCSPINYIWDKSIEGGKCIDTKAFFISSAALNIVSDFVVLLLPIPMVWKLKINMKKKIALISLFSLGGFVCAVSVVRLQSIINMFNPNQADPTFEPGFFWSGIECSLAIVCASAPSLKPFFAVNFPRLLGSSLGSRYGANSQGKMYNGGQSSRSRGQAYALGSMQNDKNTAYHPGKDNALQTTVIKGPKRDNESEESIIHGDGILRTRDVRVEVESLNSNDGRVIP
ncbi:hypothetical protein DFP73DRAFT_197025 [Morchella snyderi]|nr:hypothetical protein DFP73DRAFT_197025 [Morchella snyderi]